MRPLPSLNAARAYEAAFRHASLTKAAKELHVTHGALSRQVAVLEGWIGQPLFIRTPSSTLVPTDLGRRYGEELTSLFDRLAVVSAAAKEKNSNVVSITASPTFTMSWLIPRMSAFQRRYPEVTLKLATSAQPAQLRDDGSDVVIHSVKVSQDRVASLPFMDDYYIPVSHVDLVEAAGKIDPAWLARQTLLSYASWPDSWEIWAGTTGVEEARVARQQQFEHMFLTRQAVLEGLGVAILPVAVVLDDIVQGRLTAPFEFRGSICRPWLACYFPSRATEPRVVRFLEWLQSEARDFESTAAACFESMGWTENPFRIASGTGEPAPGRLTL